MQLQLEEGYSEDRIMIVSDMQTILDKMASYPFAAVVVDANSRELVDYYAIAALRDIQHVALIVGYMTPDPLELEYWDSLLVPDEYKLDLEFLSSQCFTSYIISSDCRLYPVEYGAETAVDGIMRFASTAKDDLYVQYDLIVNWEFRF